MKKIYGIQSAILLFVGVGALFGGLLAISDPYGVSYGASTDLLKKGPFTNFLIPGLFLLLIIGLGHLISFIFVKFKLKFHVYISGGAGCILMAWILIQCYMLNAIHLLHIIFFLIGLFESLIALYMLIKLKLFPFTHKFQ
ncbi:hypothetical protein [Cellulosilyticum sp. I15G10I2]|uniref:hypothetical protein n=1 Tax=Cellulosilyticum sp. I15G10I2 TaxID=1892843 RepID=UPI00085CD41B|nr:hypothetical protein [Cellulosilyticum sp. I15G10I2]